MTVTISQYVCECSSPLVRLPLSRDITKLLLALLKNNVVDTMNAAITADAAVVSDADPALSSDVSGSGFLLT